MNLQITIEPEKVLENAEKKLTTIINQLIQVEKDIESMKCFLNNELSEFKEFSGCICVRFDPLERLLKHKDYLLSELSTICNILELDMNQILNLVNNEE